MALDPAFALLLAGTFVAAFASGLAGFAYALVASAAFLHVLAPVDATAMILIGSSLAQCVTIWRFRAEFDWRRLAPFLVAGIAGVPIGTALLGIADRAAVRDTVGAFLVCYAAYGLFAPPLRVPHAGGKVADAGIGFVGGVLGGLAALSGALPTVWCGVRGWSRDRQRGVYQPYILVMQLWSLASLTMSGGVRTEIVVGFAFTLPALAAGVLLGMRCYARIDERGFRRVVLLLLLASGAGLVLW